MASRATCSSRLCTPHPLPTRRGIPHRPETAVRQPGSWGVDAVIENDCCVPAGSGARKRTTARVRRLGGNVLHFHVVAEENCRKSE